MLKKEQERKLALVGWCVNKRHVNKKAAATHSMKGIILSSHPTVKKWRTLKQKLAFFDRIYNSGKNANWEPWTLETISVVPSVDKDGRINRDWLFDLQKPYFDKGYDFVKFHGSRRQRKEWGVIKTLRGSNPNENHDSEYMYFFADENSKRNGLNEFEQVGAHEGSHGYYDETGENDLTHQWHDRNPDISGLFKTFDWSKYQPKRQALKSLYRLTLLKMVQTLQDKLKTLTSDSVAPQLPYTDKLQPRVQRGVDVVIAEMKKYGHEVRLVQGFRSIEEQNKLYAQGRTTAGPVVTNAKGGQSFHNYGVAADFVFRKEGYNASDTLWSLLGAVGKKQGFTWGGDWKGFVDRPHLEMTLGYSLKDFQSGKVDWSKYK